MGQRTEEGFGAKARSLGWAAPPEGSTGSKSPIAATTAGPALSAPASFASASPSRGLRNAISIAIDRGWKPANARTRRAIISRVGASLRASLSASSSIATMATLGGAGRAPARRKRQSRVRFSIRSSGEARPLVSCAPRAAPTTSAAARKAPVRSREGPGRSVPIHSPKRERSALTRSSPHVLATTDVSVGVMSTPCPSVRTTN